MSDADASISVALPSLSTGASFCPGTTNAGYRATQSAQVDCDDASVTIYPGAPETCANDGVDNDCDGEGSADSEATDSVSYYIDGDGDGYGAGAATKSCTAIAGSVTNNTDCNDASASINPTTVWYQDSDGDGAGDPAVTLTQCAQPSGYVAVGGDLCPTTAARNAPITWYLDADGDGFGAPSPTQTACTAPVGYVSIDSDCNDGNAQIRPNTVWYRDLDGDGAGDPSVTLVQCVQPAGYILVGGDTCPSDPGKTAPGQCGCGAADTDSDGDGTADCNDTTITRTMAGGSIPDNSASGLQKTFALSSSDVFYGISDIKVTLTGLSHANLGDLTVQLIGPANTTASIFTRIGGTDSSNFSGNYAFADAFTGNIWTEASAANNAQNIPSGNYFPSSSTGARVNLTAAFASVGRVGTWTVRISDNAAGTTGTISSITVDITPSPAVDSDGDGTFDMQDGCPSDAGKTAPGQCGCGVADTDSDGDGVANCVDLCPNDTNKTAPGQCGCGALETDSDGDGTANCVDSCPNDPAKIQPGACGCGIADTDADADGTADCLEVSPVVAMSALDSAVAPGETVVVRVSSGSPGSVVTSLRIVARYDASRLLFVQAVPVTGTAFTEVEENPTAPPEGTVRHSATVPAGHPGVTTATNLVDLYFTALPGETICGASNLVYFDTIGGESTRFVNQGNNPVTPTLSSLGAMRIDGAAPALGGVPASRSGAVDAESTTGAYYAPPAVTALDDCDGSMSASLLVTYPNGATGSVWPANGIFPVGTTTLRWTISDAVGNQSTATRSVTVSNNQLLDAGITLGGAVTGNSTRAIRVKAGNTTQIVQVPMAQAAGSAQSVSLPVAAGYNCITIKDAVHSLSSSATPTVVNGRYTASYTLRQGDCNDDDKVDIVDFSYFVANRGATVGPNATANFNSDSVVNNADLSFISLSFFQVGNTCGSYTGAPPVDRVTVKELRRAGLGHLAIADLNCDGAVDMTDVAHYMQYGMPAAPQPAPVSGTPIAE
ncbi:MAG: MopE-related protein [Planctomycetota bacterium]